MTIFRKRQTLFCNCWSRDVSAGAPSYKRSNFLRWFSLQATPACKENPGAAFGTLA
jgi:hypothetical protein